MSSSSCIRRQLKSFEMALNTDSVIEPTLEAITQWVISEWSQKWWAVNKTMAHSINSFFKNVIFDSLSTLCIHSYNSQLCLCAIYSARSSWCFALIYHMLYCYSFIVYDRLPATHKHALFLWITIIIFVKYYRCEANDAD